MVITSRFTEQARATAWCVREMNTKWERENNRKKEREGERRGERDREDELKVQNDRSVLLL